MTTIAIALTAARAGSPEARLMLADILEEAGDPAAFAVRSASALIVEPRGRGWFVGLSHARGAAPPAPEIQSLTFRLAALACDLWSER